jgi:hypothetical protein
MPFNEIGARMIELSHGTLTTDAERRRLKREARNER